MPLKEKLQAVKTQMAQLPAEVLHTLSTSLQKLVDSHLSSKALKANDKAPMAILKDGDGQDVDLSHFLDKGPLVLVFYRGLWCPFCNQALSAYQQMVSDLAASGATLVAVSAQTPEYSHKTGATLGIDYQLLSDVDNHLARQYGIVFKLEDELDEVYRALGADLKSFNGNDSLTLPLASAFVIGQDAVIREAFINVDYSQRVEPEELIAAVGRV